MREGFAGAYGDEWEGKDTESNIVRSKAGFTTTKDAARREEFAPAYGTEWEGKDAESHLASGVAPMFKPRESHANAYDQWRGGQ